MSSNTPQFNRTTTLPSSSSSNNRVSLHRQIYIVIASALGLFVTSTFILSAYIPSPTDHDNNEVVFHSIAKVVRGHHHLHFEEPKGHLRRKNDMRYEREEIIISESSKSGHDVNNHQDDNHQDDEENIKNIQVDDDKGNDDGDDETPGSDEQSENNVDQEVNADKDLKKDESSIDDENNVKTETKTREASYSSDKENNESAKENDSKESVQAEKEHQPQTIVAKSDDVKEPPRIFHILETRFMQNQPDLVQLAKARLQLFEAICLPTVIQQTAWGNFLWIIRTDPDLHVDIRRDLVKMLSERGALTTAKNEADGTEERALTYVIGSNDNYIVANSTTVNPQIRPFDIHDMFSNMLSKPDKIFAGSVEHLQLLLDGLSSETKDVIMWTRLDADDGLSVEFLKYVQDQMVRYFVPEKVSDTSGKTYKKKKADFRRSDSEDDEENDSVSNDADSGGRKDEGNDAKKAKASQYVPPNWMYWCGGQNIDWFLTDPIHDAKHDAGVVYPVLHHDVCVTPGITVSIRGGVEPALVPRLDHDKIISYLDDVGGKACNRTGLQDDDELPDDGSCFKMIHGYTHAIRSRTPTSAGMMGVNPDENQLKMVLHHQGLKKIMWREIHGDFLLKDDELRKTNTYFAEHLYDIAEENARGQCTNGHSCKTSSKDRLQQYVDLRGESDGGFDVVDGIIIKPKLT